MKNILYDKEDILPIILLALSTAIMNFGICFFSAFSTMMLVFLVFVNIFIIFKLKHSEYIPPTTIIKYSIYCLLLNSLSYFLVLCLKISGLGAISNLVLSNFIHVGLNLAIGCALFLWMFSTLLKNNKKNKKPVGTMYDKYAPQIIMAVFLFCNISMFILTKNILDVIIGIMIVIPYIWYVFSLAIKSQNSKS